LLFLPFRQLDPSITRKFGGSGLGLAIVKSLVVMMNGSITLDSDEGTGSCFVVKLPLEATDQPPDELLTAPIALASGMVLVVEDNEFNRRLLKETLTSWGQQVLLAENGLQALQLMDQQRFDLVLLDIRMPDIDGIEVARRIRQREREQSETAVPIIAITADTDAATREACLAAGINAFLAKPVSPEQVATAIATLCGGALPATHSEELLLNEQTCRNLGPNSERARQYREILRKDIDEELQCLQIALERDDRKELGRAAHTLKGLYGHLVNQEPAELAAWLQDNAHSARTEQLHQVKERLQATDQYRVAQEPREDIQ
jgi:CheY-like chemotaxis protein